MLFASDFHLEAAGPHIRSALPFFFLLREELPRLGLASAKRTGADTPESCLAGDVVKVDSRCAGHPRPDI